MADVKDFGDFITSEYEILRKVFENLSVSDLEHCQAVCTAWKSAVDVTVKRRRCIQCLYEMADQKCPPFIESDAVFVLTFCGIAVSDDVYNWCYMTKKSQQFIASLGTIVNILGKPTLYKPLRGARREQADKVLASVRFPPWDGVYFSHFRYISNLTPKNDIIKLVDESVPTHVEIKAVIILSSNQPGRPHALHVVDHLRNRQEHFPLAGGYNTENDSYIYCYVFWGPNVHAKSCVLSENTCNEAKVSSRLKTFSESFSPSDNGVIVVFSCIQRDKANSKFAEDRNENLYRIEQRTLDRFFPNCNRIGCLSAGEFGMDCPPIRCVKRQRMDCYHSYSTVLIYIWFD